MVTFRYAPAILARYPAVVGGVTLASGLTNGLRGGQIGRGPFPAGLP